MECETMATIQKRKNKNGSFSYKVMIRSQDGFPPAYKSFPTYQEAKDWAIQEEARRRQGVYFPDTLKKRNTLNDLISSYLDNILPMKPKNAKDTKRHLEWWKKRIGSLPLNRITSQIIAGCRKELAQTLTPKGILRSPSTTNRYIASFSVALTYGVKELGWLSENPAFRVSKLKEPEGRDRVLNQNECKKLLQACLDSKNNLLYPIVLLALTTGARKGEILSLTWDCVDLEKGIIQLKKTKNNHPRSIPLVGNALKALHLLHSQRKSHHQKVFPSKKHFCQIDIRKSWTKACQKAGLSNLRMHDLRHCFATFASKAGASNMELLTAMGHRTLQMLKRYCHMDSMHTKRFSEHVDQFIMEENA